MYAAKKPTAIDLFCGAGGLTVGLKQGGFNVLAGVEFNPVAAETYKMNHKRNSIYQCDIKELDPYVILKDLGLVVGELDLLAGCPPCQGFSSHRTRNKGSSVIDERNDLVFEFIRFVRAMKPKTIMMENVPGLAKDDRIEEVKSELKELGYYINDKTVQVKDAAFFGVPQRRKRMILQASLMGFIEEPKESSKFVTVQDVIGGLESAGSSGDYLHDLPVIRTPKIEKMISLIPKDGGSRRDLDRKYWLPCHIRSPNSYLDVYGRMSWKKVSPTITGGCTSPSKGRFIHPEFDRAITLREAALLQTFPKNYKFSLARGKDFVALMVGNALPPTFIKKHAVQFKKHLGLFA